MKFKKFVLYFFGIVFSLQSCLNKDGCTNVTALNYDPAADQDDGSCLYSLAVPETYYFNRGDSSTVFYGEATVRNLLINDLNLIIRGLAETGATSIGTSTLLPYYQTSGLEQAIQTPTTGFSAALQSTFAEISTASLASEINNTFGAGDSILIWLDTIAVQSQDVGLLGTNAVYSYSNGIDLQQMVHTTFLGAVIYHQIIDNLTSVEAANSTSLVEGTNYTTQEHTWDAMFGYLGTARNYGLCSDSELASEDFAGKDWEELEGNLDGLLDWTSEYSFGFARLAAKRDVAVSERNFTGQLFSLLLQGRTAITNKNQVEMDLSYSVVVDSLELVLEELVAASLVHHLNRTLEEMANLGTASENVPQLNSDWSGMLGFAQMFRYRNTSGNTPLSDENLTEILTWIGDSPNYSLEGTDGYTSYVANLASIKSLLQMVYGFSEAELEGW